MTTEADNRIPLHVLENMLWDERYWDIKEQMPRRAERVLASLVEQRVLPSAEGSPTSPRVTLELIREVLATDRRLHGVAPMVFENETDVGCSIGNSDGQRVVDVGCVRDIILQDALINSGKLEKYEQTHYFADSARKILGILRDRGQFPEGRKVYLGRDFVREILTEDMRLAQAGDLPHLYEVTPPRDETEVDRMAEDILDYEQRRRVYIGQDLSENVEFAEEVLYLTSIFLAEERREEQEREGGTESYQYRSVLDRLIQKGAVPSEQGHRAVLTMDLLREIVFAKMELDQEQGYGSYGSLTEFWYVDPDAKHRVYGALQEKCGDVVQVDLEFLEQVFEEVFRSRWI